MAPKKTVERELFDQIVTNIRDAHSATNRLFEERIVNVTDALARIERSQAAARSEFQAKAELLDATNSKLEERQNRIERRLYWLLGAAATFELIFTLVVSSHWRTP